LLPFPFKWNDAFWLKRRCFIHCSLKKRPKTVPFWTTPYVFFFPWTCRKQGKGAFVPLCFPPPSPLKRRRPKTLSCSVDPWPPTCWRNGGDVGPWAIVGRQYSGHPSYVSPMFSYKYRGDEEEKGGKIEREENDIVEKIEKRRRKGKKKKKKQKRKKQRRERKKKEKHCWPS